MAKGVKRIEEKRHFLSCLPLSRILTGLITKDKASKNLDLKIERLTRALKEDQSDAKIQSYISSLNWDPYISYILMISIFKDLDINTQLFELVPIKGYQHTLFTYIGRKMIKDFLVVYNSRKAYIMSDIITNVLEKA